MVGGVNLRADIEPEAGPSGCRGPVERFWPYIAADRGVVLCVCALRGIISWVVFGHPGKRYILKSLDV